jgi:2-dehydro-3-deoxygalactonokinase
VGEEIAAGMRRVTWEGGTASYLCGMLIGHEIRSAYRGRGRVHALCSAQLPEMYGLAFAVLAIEENALDPDSVTKGLFRLATYL